MVNFIADAADRYSKQNGLYVPDGLRGGYGGVAITRSASNAIGNAYGAMPDFDPKSVPAYKALAEETGRQYDFITKPRSKGGMGIDAEVTHQDPYGQGAAGVNGIINEIQDDVANHNRMKVFSTAATGGHPVFTNDQNDQFRFVHDIFGHLGSGRGIDQHGEEAAYQKHSTMFSPLARQALATETRGQNAALHLNGDFQDQKIGFLPSHMQALQFSRTGGPAQYRAAIQDAAIENNKQGLS